MASGKPKYIQLDYDLFWRIMLYFFSDDFDEYDYIKTNLKKKFDRMLMHELYTKYKTSDSEEEKEEARQEYLDRIGVPESFRW